MIKKFKFLFVLLFLACLSVSCVSAADYNQTNVNNNHVEGNDISLVPTDNIDANIDESSISQASSNVWYVDSNVNSNGDGKTSYTAFKTLTEAISNSNDGDTIFIASGIYSGKENVGIIIFKSLNLIGYGNEKPIFDGGNTSYIFDIHTGFFNMTGLTFTNAYNAHVSAISMTGVRICNLINCDFKYNVKPSIINVGFKSCGGAIYAVADEINLIGCNFIGNSADVGGAAFINALTNIIYCTFDNNSAEINGGAIVVQGKGITDVISSIFTNNHVSEEGGAAYFYGDTNINGSIFERNTAENHPDYYISTDSEGFSQN